jgi:hypothetical protein
LLCSIWRGWSGRLLKNIRKKIPEPSERNQVEGWDKKARGGERRPEEPEEARGGQREARGRRTNEWRRETWTILPQRHVPMRIHPSFFTIPWDLMMFG